VRATSRANNQHPNQHGDPHMPSPLRDSKNSIETRLLEAFDALWDDLVDPREAYADADGWWQPVGSTPGGATRTAFDEPMLAELRRQSRQLAATNEFAINGLENRISYIVGAGH